MAEVEFIYKGISINIVCNKNEKMKDICGRFINEAKANKNLIYYLYNGSKINEELTLENIINNRNINKIKILANLINEEIRNSILIKSKDIICPECKENIRIKIEDYKIKLYECKNNHTINNIFLEKYEDTQYIDISKIICEICKEKNKGNAHDNIFYRCTKCKINLCPLCKSKHDKSHNIINYDLKDYICEEHNELYIEYCLECKKNICLSCENNHKNHETIFYKNIMRDKNELKNDINEYKKEIDIFNYNIDYIINKLKKVKENMIIYYNIFKKMIDNYEIRNRNYTILKNLNEINNNIIRDIKEINKDEMNDKIYKILNLYNKMIFSNDITIIYNTDNKNGKVRLFGSKFVKNNIRNCKVLIENKESELMKEYKISNKKSLEIKLAGINKVTDISYMFYECNKLSSIPDNSYWNTSNVVNMSYMFYGCDKLSSLPDISKWNTEKVTNMCYMFSYCHQLSSLPDISNWDTSNVTDMSYMFYDCYKLSSLPDISKWNTSNVINMNEMFYRCSKLSSLPDISKWNIDKVTNMCEMFCNCFKLSSLPDISKWNTNKVTDMSYMFYCCSKLSSLPDISKWNINNVTNLNEIFGCCSSDLKIPSKFIK